MSEAGQVALFVLAAVQGAQAPPMPPPVIVGGGPPEEVFFALFAMIAVVVAGIVLYPVARALARRLERHQVGEDLRAELDNLHDRLEQLERVETRVLELENRVEFSERLLANPRPGLPEGERR
jgi:hypothetical protein